MFDDKHLLLPEFRCLIPESKAIWITRQTGHSIFRCVSYECFHPELRYLNNLEFLDWIYLTHYRSSLTYQSYQLDRLWNSCICTSTSHEDCLRHICHHVGSCCFHRAGSFESKSLVVPSPKDNPMTYFGFVLGCHHSQKQHRQQPFSLLARICAWIASITWDSVSVYHFWIIDSQSI